MEKSWLGRCKVSRKTIDRQLDGWWVRHQPLIVDYLILFPLRDHSTVRPAVKKISPFLYCVDVKVGLGSV